jgi:hypothetical protein
MFCREGLGVGAALTSQPNEGSADNSLLAAEPKGNANEDLVRRNEPELL